MKKYIIVFLLVILLKINFAQKVHTFNSDLLPDTDTTLVFVPNDYNPSDRYPLVILLHGWSGNYAQWDGIMGGLQQLANQYNFIICCPDGFYDSWYVNSPIKSNSQFETFFISILIPSLRKEYYIDANNIFISGLSMGGHGALTLFLKNSALFNSAASTSGILDITEFPDKWGIAKVMGNYESHQEQWKDNTVFYLLENLKDIEKEILFDCGTEDFAYKVNEKTYAKCRELNIKAAFITRPGNHHRNYWNTSLPYHMEFFRMHLKK